MTNLIKLKQIDPQAFLPPTSADPGKLGFVPAPPANGAGMVLTASGWSTPMRRWQPNTQYPLDDLVVHEGRILLCKQDHLSNASYDTDEGGKWEPVSGKRFVRIGASTYTVGDVDVITVEALSTTITLPEASTRKTRPITIISDWGAGSTVTLQKTGFFDSVFGPVPLTIPNQSSIVLMPVLAGMTQGWQVVNAGIAFRPATAVSDGFAGLVPHPPTGSINDVLTSEGWGGAIKDWRASRAYRLGDLVFYAKKLYRRTVAGTSGTAFDAAEEANWEMLGGGGGAEIEPHDPLKDYSAGSIVSWRGLLAIADGPIVAPADMFFGKDANEWRPLLDSFFNWRGEYAEGQTYEINDVVSANGTSLFWAMERMAPATNDHPMSGTKNRSRWATINNFINERMTGATSTRSGRQGEVPTPLAGDHVKFLRGDGVWTDVATTEPWVRSKSYVAGDRVLFRGIIAQANAAIPANTNFSYNTTGATWTPILGSELTWKGVYANGLAYAASDVVAMNNGTLVRCLSAIASSTNDHNPNTGKDRYLWREVTNTHMRNFGGASASTAGHEGLIPAPTIDDRNKFLKANGQWSDAGKYPDYVASLAYKTGERVWREGILIEAAGDVAASTTFAWGTAANQWKLAGIGEALDVGKAWRGVYAASTNYSVGDVVAASSTTTTMFYICITAHTSPAGSTSDRLLGGGSQRNQWGKTHPIRQVSKPENHVFHSPSNDSRGRSGAVPEPWQRGQEFLLTASGWTTPARVAGGVTAITNQASSTSVDTTTAQTSATTGVGVTVMTFAQSTESVIITLNPPKDSSGNVVSAQPHRITTLNTGSVAVGLRGSSGSTVYELHPGAVVDWFWHAASAIWRPVTPEVPKARHNYVQPYSTETPQQNRFQTEMLIGGTWQLRLADVPFSYSSANKDMMCALMLQKAYNVMACENDYQSDVSLNSVQNAVRQLSAAARPLLNGSWFNGTASDVDNDNVGSEFTPGTVNNAREGFRLILGRDASQIYYLNCVVALVNSAFFVFHEISSGAGYGVSARDFVVRNATSLEPGAVSYPHQNSLVTANCPWVMLVPTFLRLWER